MTTLVARYLERQGHRRQAPKSRKSFIKLTYRGVPTLKQHQSSPIWPGTADLSSDMPKERSLTPATASAYSSPAADSAKATSVVSNYCVERSENRVKTYFLLRPNVPNGERHRLENAKTTRPQSLGQK